MCCSFFSLPLLRYQNFLGFKIYFDVGNDAPGWNEINSLPPPFLPSFSFVSVRYIGQFISLFAPPLFFFFFFVATFKWNISICPWLSVRAHVPWYASSRLINATSMSLYFSACYKKISKIPFHSFHSLNNRFRIIFFFFSCKTPISNRLHYLVERIFLYNIIDRNTYLSS